MKIAIDGRAFTWTGIGRYIRNLVRELQWHPEHEFTLLLGAKNVPAFERLSADWPRRPKIVVVEDSYYSWREHVFFRRQIENLDVDLFHFTHFNVPLFFRRPYIVTIHDVTRFLFPGQNNTSWIQQIAYEQIFSRAVEGSKGVIAVSQTTARELSALPLGNLSPIETIYEGIDDIFFQSIPRLNQQKIPMLLGTDSPYILSVGVWMNHKNLERLLLAFKEILIRQPKLKLVVTGRPKPGYVNVLRLAEQMGIDQHVIFPGFVPHTLLPALYGNAQLFIFPSLYEGFGLPPLEAAACGAPVVATNGSSVPEIMGENAIYCNPEDGADMARAMEVGLNLFEAKRQELVVAGKKRAAGFRWSIAADKHVQLYERFLRKT